MSRLPTLSTPGRFTTPPPTANGNNNINGTGIPTPTSHRRPRSSLGPGIHNSRSTISTPPDGDEAMDQLQEALRNRPAPGSIKSRDLSGGSGGGSGSGNGDPDTPTQLPGSASASASASALSASAFTTVNTGLERSSLAAPRTPALRSRTPSALGLGSSIGLGHAPITPSSRPASRPSLSGRSSFGGPTASGTGAGVFTPRRPSMASSTTSTTPHARRSESRASNVHDVPSMVNKFDPKIGDRVRIQSLGQEGTLRFMGNTNFKAGVWAGVELSGGFAGMGKNDGSVDGVPYFTCPPNCGIFVLFSKLSAPTSGPSRSASAASHRSLASSHASFSINGRATPSISGRATPSNDRVRPATTTPGRSVRAVSQSVKGIQRLTETDESSPSDPSNRPVRTTLGASSNSNALPEVRVTAGSRASKYVGMTAKQLDTARAGGVGVNVNGNSYLNKSLLGASTTTPKASRVSMGGITPARGRQSIGGGMVTPKPRGRISTATEMMPPPPSPSNVARALAQNHQSSLEAEVESLKQKNRELEERLRSSNHAHIDDEYTTTRLKELKTEVEKIKDESDSLRYQLTASQAECLGSGKTVTELSETLSSLKAELEEKEREYKKREKEMGLEKERMRGEMEAGMEARRGEIRRMELRAEGAEVECADMRGLVEELTQAGQATISLYERKLNDSQNKQYDLESQLRTLETQILKLKEEAQLSNLPTSPGTQSKKAISAAEIDNENLTAQLKHLQTKISNLEEELDEARHQADVDLDNWKSRVAKVKEGEAKAKDDVRRYKIEIEGLKGEIGGGRGRIAELESALKENQIALESTRAEVESLRIEAAEAVSMRAALQTAHANEKDLAKSQDEIAELKSRLAIADAAEARVTELETKVVALQTELSSLQQVETPIDPSRLSISIPSPARSASPTQLHRESSSSLSVSESSPSNTNTPQRSKPRLSIGSNGSSSGHAADKTLRGFQHIIQELTGENAELKARVSDLEEEVGLLKQEIKLLEETAEMGGEGGGKELMEAKEMIHHHVRTIKELNQEVSELESLIESKIYREDELETRAQKLERDVEIWKSKAVSLGRGHRENDDFSVPNSANSTSTSTFLHSRNTSVSTSGLTDTTDRSGLEDGNGERCELCEGPHGLDMCPVFAGSTLGGTDGIGEEGPSPLAGRQKKSHWCADCESTDHDTVDCPMAEEVF